MQFSFAAIVAAFVATVAANSNGTVVWVTTTTTALTTVCPSATTVTYGGVTYTATASQVLTITNCPCTISHPVTVIPSTTVVATTAAPPPVYANSTLSFVIPASPVTTSLPVTTTKPTPSAFTGGANNNVIGSAAGIAGLFGLAALVL